nr:DUF6049 family protein [Nocardioides daedukensis]
MRAPGSGVSAALALLMISALLVLLGVPAPASATVSATASTSAEPEDPLQLSITGMDPSVVPASGRVTLRGEITNVTDEEWRDVRVYPRISYSALRTAQELRTAAQSDPMLAFGDRITTEGAFDDSIKTLAPGAKTTWQLRVPAKLLRDKMSLEDGVYQIGVQALGANSEGRSSSANGRARTFIPLMGVGHPKVPASLVVPVRRSIREDKSGRIAAESAWADDLADGGRLANLASLMDSGALLPTTWLVDPAVLDAVRRLSRGNPRRTLAGAESTDAQPTTSPDTEEHPAAASAEEWLGTFTAIGADRSMLALPYGDLDVAAASRKDEGLYARARELSDRVLQSLSLDAEPAIAPPSGRLPEEALSLADDDESVFLAPEGIKDRARNGITPPGAVVDGRPVTIHEDSIAVRAEGDVATGLTTRQRILAETSIRSLAGVTDGVVFNLPSDFDPGPMTDDFLQGLRRSYISWGDLDTTRAASDPVETTANYSPAETRAEVSTGTLNQARELISLGSRLASILTLNETIDADLGKLAMSSSSVHARSREADARTSLQTAIGWSQRQLGRITIDAPSFVILSSDSGAFAIKIRNRLAQPVSVTLVATSRDEISIEAPSEISLGPDSTRTVTLNANAGSIGVHPVTLRLADAEGRPFGEEEQMNVRSNTVGKVIWVILGIGVGILFLAIAIRWVRRLRGRRSAPDESPDTTAGEDA